MLHLYQCLLFQSSECSQRLVPCQYCELEIVYSQSKEHEDYCGTRTEPCPHCKCNVMFREKAVHPVLCGSLTPPQERNNSRTSRSPVDLQSPGPWFEAHSIRNHLRGQERGPKNNNISAAEQQAFPRPFDPRVYNTSRGSQSQGDWKNITQRNTPFSHCEFLIELLNLCGKIAPPSLITYWPKMEQCSLKKNCKGNYGDLRRRPVNIEKSCLDTGFLTKTQYTYLYILTDISNEFRSP